MYTDIAMIIPTYSQLDYARQSVESFFKYTENGIAIVVDDASPDWDQKVWSEFPEDRCIVHRFDQNGGLTRSWNWGLAKAKKLKAKYTVAGNSDILFTLGWDTGLRNAIDNGYDLVGPVTNAPGSTSKKGQYIRTYIKDYEITDDEEYNDSIAQRLAEEYRDTIHEVGVNGFFMFSSTKKWWIHRFNDVCVFNPAKKLVGNEDEFQKRLRRRNGKIAVIPSSFIFHYRSVSRGFKKVAHNKGWYRK